MSTNNVQAPQLAAVDPKASQQSKTLSLRSKDAKDVPQPVTVSINMDEKDIQPSSAASERAMRRKRVKTKSAGKNETSDLAAQDDSSLANSAGLESGSQSPKGKSGATKKPTGPPKQSGRVKRPIKKPAPNQGGASSGV